MTSRQSFVVRVIDRPCDRVDYSRTGGLLNSEGTARWKRVPRLEGKRYREEVIRTDIVKRFYELLVRVLRAMRVKHNRFILSLIRPLFILVINSSNIFVQ